MGVEYLKHILQCGIYLPNLCLLLPYTSRNRQVFDPSFDVDAKAWLPSEVAEFPGPELWKNLTVVNVFFELEWAHFNGISQNVAWFSWISCRLPKNLISKMMDPPLFQRFFCCCRPGFGVWPCRGAIGKYLEGGRKRRHGSTKNPTRMGFLGQPNLKKTAGFDPFLAPLCCRVGENHTKKNKLQAGVKSSPYVVHMKIAGSSLHATHL